MTHSKASNALGQAPYHTPQPRILHLVRTLRFGGIETWLVHLMRHRERFDVRHEILLMVDEIGPYEPEVKAMGIPIHKLPMDRGWINWLRRLKTFIREQGPFDVIHSHAAVLGTAPILAIAASAGVSVRIAHSHEARHLGADYTAGRKIMRAAAMAMIRMFSTRRIGISDAAITEVSGNGWRSQSRSSILLYGFDYSANDGASDRAADLRRRLEIPDGAKIVGHVGRFAPVKNHDFVLRSFAALRKRRSGVHLVLVGTGDLMDSARRQATKLGIADAVRFAGPTADVPGFMSLFDAFLFPSFSEGLGIVVLEAQAAGTPTLMTDSLPHEVIVIEEAVERLSLDCGPDAWAERLDGLLDVTEPEAGAWRRAVEESAFGMRRCVDELDKIYREELAGRR